MTAKKPEHQDQEEPDSSTSAGYHIADLPQEDVQKLQRLEEELRADTGEEVVVIAYEKEPATGSSISSETR